MNDSFLATIISPNDLSVRAYNCLKNARISTIGELIAKTETDLLRYKNFGKKSLKDVEKYLSRHNLGLGTCSSYTAETNIDYKKLALPLSDFNLSVRSSGCLERARINTIGDLVKKTDLELLRLHNFGQKSLKEIRNVLVSLRLRLGMEIDDKTLAEHVKLRFLAESKPIDNIQISFHDCLKYIRNTMTVGNSIKVLNNKKLKDIVESRLGTGKSRATLKDLAKRFSLSRERIRQLEKKAGDMVISAFDPLNRHFLIKFSEEIKNSEGIKTFEDDKTILGTIEFKLFNIALTSINRKIIFDYDYDTWFMCNKDKLFARVSGYLSKNCKAGRPYTQQEAKLIVDNCKLSIGLSCEPFSKVIMDKWFEVYGGYYFYKIISKPEVMGLLIKEHYPQGMAVYKDIKSFINLCKTNGLEDFIPKNERALIGLILRSQELVLWDWGVYIHKSRINVDESLLRDVREWLTEKFDMGITRLSAWAAFSKFKEICEKSNITNEHALYSCLKMKFYNDFRFPKDPIICSLRARKKMNKCQILENYLLDQKNGVELWKIEEDLGLKRFQLDQIESDRILPWGVRGNRKLINIDNIDFDRTDYRVLSQSLIEPIKKYKHISVIKIYQDNYDIVKRNNIPGAYALYSYLSHELTGKYYFPRYPYILKKDHNIDNDGSLSFNDLVIDYFTTKNAPLTHDELYNYFIKERGYPKTFLLNITYLCDKIVMYEKNVYILLDLLNWNDDKDNMLRSVILQKLSTNSKAGYSFVSINELLNQDNLPKIDENISIKWQNMLLRELLGRFEFLKFSDNKKDTLISLCDKDMTESQENNYPYGELSEKKRDGILGAMVFNRVTDS